MGNRLWGWTRNFTNWAAGLLRDNIKSVIGSLILLLLGGFITLLASDKSNIPYLQAMDLNGWMVPLLYFLFVVAFVLMAIAFIVFSAYLLILIWWCFYQIFKPWIFAVKYESLWMALASERGIISPDETVSINTKDIKTSQTNLNRAQLIKLLMAKKNGH